MKKLILLRHGESIWNKENRFTGWTDVDLSPKGLEEARNSGRLLRENGFAFDVAYTSVLKRAIRTLWIALEYRNRSAQSEANGEFASGDQQELGHGGEGSADGHLCLQRGARCAVPLRIQHRLEATPVELFHRPRRSHGCLALSPARLQTG